MEHKDVYFRYFILSAVYASFLVLFWPFKTAILLAGLFAAGLTPILNRWKNKIPKENLLVFILVVGLLTIIITPITLVVIKGVLNIGQLQQSGIDQQPLYKNIQSTVTTVWNYLSGFAAHFNLNLSEDFDIQSLLPRTVQFILPWITSVVTNFPDFLLQLFIFISCLYFFLLKKQPIFYWLKNKKLLPHDSLVQLVTLLQRICYTVVVSTLIVSTVQASIVTVAAAIAGFDSLVVIFILVFFMAFIPVVGSIPVTLSLALYSFLQGDTGYGILIVIAASLAGVLDNVIRAWILSSDEESIHPLISLITLIGALIVFGISGLFLGPIIAELAFSIGNIMSSPIQIEEPKQLDSP